MFLNKAKDLWPLGEAAQAKGEKFLVKDRIHSSVKRSIPWFYRLLIIAVFAPHSYCILPCIAAKKPTIVKQIVLNFNEFVAIVN